MYFKKIILVSVALLSPSIASAQTTINSILIASFGVLRNAAPVAIGLMVLLFLWGLAKYILKTDSPEGRESAKSIMIWGVVSIFVVVSMWGFVELLMVITGAGPTNVNWPQLNMNA